MENGIAEHYRRLALTYNRNWAHRPDYVHWMSVQLAAALPSGPVADIGAGTGLFLAELAGLRTPEVPVYCVDPSADMLRQLPGDPRLRPVRATAEDVATGRIVLPPLAGIVIKEAIHHIPDTEKVLRGLAKCLAPGGRLLIVTLPPVLDYPLFPAALDRFAERQPEPEELVHTLRHAGLTGARCELREFKVEVDRAEFCDLVTNRWMSVLETFTAEELDAGLRQMRETHPVRMSFVDRFAFVTAVKPG